MSDRIKVGDAVLHAREGSIPTLCEVVDLEPYCTDDEWAEVKPWGSCESFTSRVTRLTLFADPGSAERLERAEGLLRDLRYQFSAVGEKAELRKRIDACLAASNTEGE